MKINKRYVFKNESTGKSMVLELDLDCKELHLLEFNGVYKKNSCLASMYNEEMFMAVLDLFISEAGLVDIEYVTIGGV